MLLVIILVVVRVSAIVIAEFFVFWFIDLKIVIRVVGVVIVVVVIVLVVVVVVVFSVSKINRFMRWYNDALFNRTTFNSCTVR